MTTTKPYPQGLIDLIEYFESFKVLPKFSEPGGSFLNKVRSGGYCNWHYVLNEQVPGWNAGKRDGSIKNLLSFIAANKRCPKVGDKTYSTLKKARAGHYPDWHDKLTAAWPTWREVQRFTIFSNEIDIEALNKKLNDWIEVEHKAMFNNYKIEERTLSLSDGTSQTLQVKIYPLSGQGVDLI